MPKLKIFRTFRRINATVLFLATIVGITLGYLQYQHQCCMDLRAVAILAHGRHDWQFASEQFNSFTLKCNAHDQQVLDLYIETEFNKGDFEEARRRLEYTQALFPSDPLPRYWDGVLSVVDKSHQDLPRATSILLSVRNEVHNDYPQVDLYLGIANLKLGDSQKGCEHLSSYLRAPRRENEDAVRRKTESTFQQRCSAY